MQRIALFIAGIVLMFSAAQDVSYAAGIPTPYRIGGTITLSRVALTPATAADLVVTVKKSDGSDYKDANGNIPQDKDGLNSSNFYIIDIPIYDATEQASGAKPGDTAKIYVSIAGVQYTVTTPTDGAITVGASGGNQTVNLTIANQGQPTHTVTPSAGPNGSISPSTHQTVADGLTTTFTVTPDPGYTASVSGTCGGNLVGTTYTTAAIKADCTVIATFTSTPPPTTYALTVTKSGSGSVTASTGTLTWNDNTGTTTYTSGTSVTLTAIPTRDSRFGGWTGCDSTSGNQCTVAMSSNRSVSVSFTQGVCTLCKVPRMDFNGNNKGDILWRNTAK
ncbi:conserved hypothetical protein, membrane or secreted [Candidatus Magnetobacterium bavaricum]|uniref:Bacterial repeat domain-containing protein n=1 Tax=Candidatus Magnetobacterium bavaricum TaxID=29290 RepID=A0A0F3GSA3_9BACT|nr:conserved hypothetical protein, membrane or secreted [Candidatus Magnetobacterium bavaricum]